MLPTSSPLTFNDNFINKTADFDYGVLVFVTTMLPTFLLKTVNGGSRDGDMAMACIKHCCDNNDISSENKEDNSNVLIAKDTRGQPTHLGSSPHTEPEVRFW